MMDFETARNYDENGRRFFLRFSIYIFFFFGAAKTTKKGGGARFSRRHSQAVPSSAKGLPWYACYRCRGMPPTWHLRMVLLQRLAT
jgi:hypothetical protein